jgi:deoxycytidylate deaminase
LSSGKNKKNHIGKNLVNATPKKVELLARESGLSKRDARMMAQACAAAYGSDFESVKIGCVLANKNVILSMDCNEAKSDPMQKELNIRYRGFRYPARFSIYEHSLHAETSAIKDVPYPIAQDTDWKRVKAYVFRLAPGLPLGQGLAKPCPACMHALMERGIRYVVYSTETGFATADLLAATQF